MYEQVSHALLNDILDELKPEISREDLRRWRSSSTDLAVDQILLLHGMIMSYGGIPHLFAFLRTHPEMSSDSVFVVANFDVKPSYLELSSLGNRGLFQYGQVSDLYSGETPGLFNGRLVVPPCRFYWLTDQRPAAVF